MLVLIAVVGVLSILLVVTASVAYLALPRGRLCPHCGGSTHPVILRRLLKVFSRWVQWRWCSRCGWEGARHRGPDLGPLDPPVDHDSGFRWADPDYEDVPIFYWRSDDPDGDGETRPDPITGFEWDAEEEAIEPEPTEATGPDLPRPDFRPSWGLNPPRRPWDPSVTRGSERPRWSRGSGKPRPWYLAWLVSKNPPGFQWKEQGD